MDEPRRFTVKSIKKYYEEIEEEKMVIYEQTAYTAISAIALIASITSGVPWLQVLGVTVTKTLISNTKDLLNSIACKTGLESELACLEEQWEIEYGRGR